jgi:phosphatidylglycerol:prolipoprotein diacylglycerol transferase
MQTLAALPFFKLGPWTPIPGLERLEFHSFGMFVAIGLLVCLAMAARRGERKLGLNGERVQNYGLWLIFIGWVFAHILNVLFYEPASILENPLVLLKVWGSISSYGGLIGGIFGYWLWKRYNPEEDHEMWLDHSVWTLTFAWFFGRVGCASVHDHLGVRAPSWWPLGYENIPYGGGETHIPWEMLGIQIYFDKVDPETGAFLSHSFSPEGLVRHDLGLYEAIWWGVIVLTVLWLDRKPRRKGLYIAIVPLMYAPCRFLLDFLRAWPIPESGQTYDVPAHTQFFLDLMGAQAEPFIVDNQAMFADTRYWGLTPAQYLSIVLFVFGLYYLWRIRDRKPMEWEQYKRD